jgi:hypothetical protein
MLRAKGFELVLWLVMISSPSNGSIDRKLNKNKDKEKLIVFASRIITLNSHRGIRRIKLQERRRISRRDRTKTHK